MRLNRTCQDVTRLVLERQDRELALTERVAVRLHMLICKACPTFAKQVDLMRGAMAPWRHYRDKSGDK
jgi:Putative zinc-finger